MRGNSSESAIFFFFCSAPVRLSERARFCLAHAAMRCRAHVGMWVFLSPVPLPPNARRSRLAQAGWLDIPIFLKRDARSLSHRIESGRVVISRARTEPSKNLPASFLTKMLTSVLLPYYSV